MLLALHNHAPTRSRTSTSGYGGQDCLHARDGGGKGCEGERFREQTFDRNTSGMLFSWSFGEVMIETQSFDSNQDRQYQATN